jgi:hypothetical protein
MAAATAGGAKPVTCAEASSAARGRSSITEAVTSTPASVARSSTRAVMRSASIRVDDGSLVPPETTTSFMCVLPSVVSSWIRGSGAFGAQPG